jgi:hypothetical protein
MPTHDSSFVQTRNPASPSNSPYPPMPRPEPDPDPDPLPCPVILIAQDLLSTIKGVKKVMNRLRRAQAQCAVCNTFPGGCPFIQELHAQINLAILEVEKDFGLI